MIYLDYSASTPVNETVLDSFIKASKDFVGNANSLHKLGEKNNNLIANATSQIANLLNVKESEIIYTSGSSESNNLAIKGIAFQYQNRGKHIISSYYEHSSVQEVLNYLKSIGFEISYVNYDENGLIDLKHLESLIRDDTILVTINHINSELGLIQPITEIGNIVKKYPKCFYHVDLTQSIGKIKVDLDNIDLASFSSHKFYGLKGIGCLIKKENIKLVPLIHGGKSTTDYRSGTPAHPLIVSLAKSLRLALEDLDKKYEYVNKLNKYLKEHLEKIPNVKINSNNVCLPHILNISILGIKAETFMHALENYDIYVSTKSACSDENSLSESVLNLTHDDERAKSSIRISLSHLTTFEELDYFIDSFQKCCDKLSLH